MNRFISVAMGWAILCSGFSAGAATYYVNTPPGYEEPAPVVCEAPPEPPPVIQPVTQNLASTPADSPTSINVRSFTWTGSESLSFRCSLDGAEESPCASGFSTGPLADGTHTFLVRATDPAGNVEAAPPSQTFVITTPAPAPEPTPTPVVPPTCTLTFSGAQVYPPNASPGTGQVSVTLDTEANTLSYTITFAGLLGPETAAHIHGPAPLGRNAMVLHPVALGSQVSGVWSYAEAQEDSIRSGLTYVDIHSAVLPGGEIRGQILCVP